MSTTSQDPPPPVARNLTRLRIPVSDPRVRPLLNQWHPPATA